MIATGDLLFGDQAVVKLIERSQLDDPGASSHWRKYHADFRVERGELEGLVGFGNLERRRSAIIEYIHILLQRRYRRLAKGMPDFARADSLMEAIAYRQVRRYGLDLLRQTLTYCVVAACLPEVAGPANANKEPRTFAVIGDGFGSLTSLILAADPCSRVVLVNLTKTLLADVVYLKKAIPGIEIGLADTAAGVEQALSGCCRVVAIEARHHEALRSAPLDLVFNVASMQEMDPPVVAAYFNDMRAVAARRTLYFYCCNRTEKTLPDGTVARFIEYPWNRQDRIIFDHLCPWHQEYYTVWPPFYRAYDGPIQHRLVKLAA